MNWTIRSEQELDQVANHLIELANACPILLFKGEMGSGKTTLIKAICEELGVVDTPSSPTFSLVNQYDSSSGKTIYHFDLHRIESVEELLDLGFEDYLDSGSLCLIEWPELASPLLPESVISIQLEGEGSIRQITVEKT